MHSQIKVCFIIHSLGIGGMERVMAELAKNFSARDGVEVHLVLIGKSREIFYKIPDSVIAHKPDFTFDNQNRKRDTVRTLFFIRRTVKKIDPDTVLSFGEMWNNLALLALKGLNYPVYVSDRSKPGKDLGRLQNMLRDKLYPNAAGYIAQTEKAAEICRENGWNNNICVIGNPIREVERDPAIEKENIVLTVGRLIPTKHVDLLIRMFAELNIPGWKLVIVGGNAKRMKLLEELEQLVIELGAGDRIFLEGERKNVDDFYNRARIFAFTSSSEGFPNVIGEALAAGLPVVAFASVAGASDMIIDGENGYLIDQFDEDVFKKKLKLLMADSQLCTDMGKKVMKEFGVSQISEIFYDFITSHITQKKESEITN